MSHFARPSSILAAALVVAACTPAAPNTPAPSAGPTASASPASPAASAVASASPAATGSPTGAPASAMPASPATSPATSAPPSAGPGLDLTKGKLLRKYDFQGIGGVYYDASRDQIDVLDGEDDDETPRRYLLRRFGRDGTFDAAVDLHEPKEDAPEAVDGFAFDLAGVPAFTYLDDEAFSLRRLYTATVQKATRLPASDLERAGLAALAADGDIFTWAVIRYDPDAPKGDTRVREIQYFRAAEDKDPEAIFRVPDPLEPTTRMVMAPNGNLYFAGPSKAGALELRRLTREQAMSTLPVSLPKIPDAIWLDPAGNLLLAYETTGNTAARITRVSPDGAPLGETEVALADGRKIFAVDGLTFDAQGHAILAGKAIAADLQTTAGLFTFD